MVDKEVTLLRRDGISHDNPNGRIAMPFVGMFVLRFTPANTGRFDEGPQPASLCCSSEWTRLGLWLRNCLGTE